MNNAPPTPVPVLHKLAGSLLFALFACLLAGGAFYALERYGAGVERAWREAQAEYADSRNRLARAAEDEDEIRRASARYRALAARGEVGPERRSDWLASLEHSRVQRRLIGLEYEIAPQRPLEGAASPGQARFMASAMKLDMLLLHEQDLLGLLDDLRRAAGALVLVKQCVIERLPGTPATAAQAQLRAHCELDFVTVQEGA